MNTFPKVILTAQPSKEWEVVVKGEEWVNSENSWDPPWTTEKGGEWHAKSQKRHSSFDI